MVKRFHLQKKMVAVVRYYEEMYLISDGAGQRVYTGNDEVTAKRILALLNSKMVRVNPAWPKSLRKRKYGKK